MRPNNSPCLSTIAAKGILLGLASYFSPGQRLRYLLLSPCILWRSCLGVHAMEMGGNAARRSQLSLAPLKRIFRPRVRAAIIVAALGVPLLAAAAGSRLFTDYLW